MHETLFDHQQEFLDKVTDLPKPVRACLYYKTGAGKSLTAMLGMKALGYTDVLVIAPPSTHRQWEELALHSGMTVKTVSHAKFRHPSFKVDRTTPVIADEFHLFGGQTGQGWRKLDRMALGLKAPLFLLSATPNYNDAERCYCVQHILSPSVVKGGYLQFLYENCTTEQNRFGMIPNVTGFKDYPDAAAFLADLPKVFYLPDDLVYDIEDVLYPELTPRTLDVLRYDERNHRMIASDIEYRHTVRYQGLVNEDGRLRRGITDTLIDLINAAGGTALVFCTHATVAYAVSESLGHRGVDHWIVTGKTGARSKDELIQAFLKDGGVMVGTATLATGTDGMDKVCDTLIILDDTDDDALRRQLIGRIMPRGEQADVSAKRVLRFVPF